MCERALLLCFLLKQRISSVAVELWYGQMDVMDTLVHFMDCILNAQRYRNRILKPVIVPSVHSCCSMTMHGPGLHETTCILQHIPVPAYIQQPCTATHSTFHNQQPHCMRQMVVTPDIDRFSAPAPPNTVNKSYQSGL